MKRIARLFSVSVLLLLSLSITADEFDNTYTTLSPAQPTQSGNKIEVLEIFWYGCPHCYSFEPYLEKWLQTKPEDVEFRRVPGVLNKSWIPHAKAYFTAEKLGILEQIHMPLFDALHREKKTVYSEDDLRAFFVEHGVDGNEYTKVYNSSEIQTKFKQAFFMARGYKLTGVPSVVVNGKYLTSGGQAGSYDNLLKIINHLVDKERQAGQE